MNYGKENGLNQTLTKINELEEQRMDIVEKRLQLEEDYKNALEAYESNKEKHIDEDDVSYYERQQELLNKVNNYLEELTNMTKEEETIFDQQVEYSTFRTYAIESLIDNATRRSEIENQIKEKQGKIEEIKSLKDKYPQEIHSSIDEMINYYQQEIKNLEQEIKLLIGAQEKVLNGEKVQKENEIDPIIEDVAVEEVSNEEPEDNEIEAIENIAIDHNLDKANNQNPVDAPEIDDNSEEMEQDLPKGKQIINKVKNKILSGKALANIWSKCKNPVVIAGAVGVVAVALTVLSSGVIAALPGAAALGYAGYAAQKSGLLK